MCKRGMIVVTGPPEHYQMLSPSTDVLWGSRELLAEQDVLYMSVLHNPLILGCIIESAAAGDDACAFGAIVLASVDADTRHMALSIAGATLTRVRNRVRAHKHQFVVSDGCIKLAEWLGPATVAPCELLAPSLLTVISDSSFDPMVMWALEHAPRCLTAGIVGARPLDVLLKRPHIQPPILDRALSALSDGFVEAVVRAGHVQGLCMIMDKTGCRATEHSWPSDHVFQVLLIHALDSDLLADDDLPELMRYAERECERAVRVESAVGFLDRVVSGVRGCRWMDFLEPLLTPAHLDAALQAAVTGCDLPLARWALGQNLPGRKRATHVFRFSWLTCHTLKHMTVDIAELLQSRYEWGRIGLEAGIHDLCEQALWQRNVELAKWFAVEYGYRPSAASVINTRTAGVFAWAANIGVWLHSGARDLHYLSTFIHPWYRSGDLALSASLCHECADATRGEQLETDTFALRWAMNAYPDVSTSTWFRAACTVGNLKAMMEVCDMPWDSPPGSHPHVESFPLPSLAARTLRAHLNRTTRARFPLMFQTIYEVARCLVSARRTTEQGCDLDADLVALRDAMEDFHVTGQSARGAT